MKKLLINKLTLNDDGFNALAGTKTLLSYRDIGNYQMRLIAVSIPFNKSVGAWGKINQFSISYIICIDNHVWIREHLEQAVELFNHIFDNYESIEDAKNLLTFLEKNFKDLNLS